MLPLIALFLRAVIQFGITFGATEIVMNTLMPIIHKAIQDVMTAFGVEEETAKDIMANEVLAFVEEVGIGAATLRTKLPIKIAEILGFSTKGWSLRFITPKVKAAVVAAGGSTLDAATAGITQLTEQLGFKAAAKGVSATAGKAIGDWLFKTIGLSLGFLYVLGNFLDFAAWPGSAFQNTFQAVFKIFGLKPDTSAQNSKILSTAMWDKINAVYKALGATGIKDPDTGEVLEFNTTNMIAICDKIAAKIIAENGKVTTQQMITALQGLMVLSTPVTDSKINAIVIANTPTQQTEQTKIVPTPAKIFTGIVSQGTLGTISEFTAREDDLIESQEELQTAAQNNLAIYLTALAGRVKYELKIVNSVTLKDGTKKYGTEQQIITGYKKTGEAKYKTIKNKFAVLDIYIFTDRNVRSKISQIVLGPTDSIKLNPTIGTLANMAENIQNNILVNDTNEIENVSQTINQQQTQQTQQQQQQQQQSAVKYTHIFTNGRTQAKYKLGPFNSSAAATAAFAEYMAKWKSYDPDAKLMYFVNSGVGTGEYSDYSPAPEVPQSTQQQQQQQTQQQQTQITIPTSTNPNKCNAQSIAEFFDPNKITYPNVETRSKLYEAFGLGLAAYYTGTGEQNSKLLAELKRRVGCSI